MSQLTTGTLTSWRSGRRGLLNRLIPPKARSCCQHAAMLTAVGSTKVYAVEDGQLRQLLQGQLQDRRKRSKTDDQPRNQIGLLFANIPGAAGTATPASHPLQALTPASLPCLPTWLLQCLQGTCGGAAGRHMLPGQQLHRRAPAPLPGPGGGCSCASPLLGSASFGWR